MTVSLFTFVDMFSRAAATAEHLLDKGVEHARALGVSEAEMLGWRLIDDMATLRFQLAMVGNFAQQWPARAAGLPIPEDIDEAPDVAVLRAGLASARAFLAGLTPAQFEGRDDAPVTFAIGPGMEPTLPAGRWLSVFATTNLNFHLVTAYGILRAKGVKLGKPDIFAAGL